MFNLFRRLIDNATRTSASYDNRLQSVLTEEQLMSVVLMLEVAHADFSSEQQEHDLVLQYLKQEFKLDSNSAEQIFQQAKIIAADSVCLHRYTSRLKQLEYSQRVELLQQLWQIAYADNVLDPNEEAMLRKIADLLFIRHSDFIQSKLAVKP